MARFKFTFQESRENFKLGLRETSEQFVLNFQDGGGGIAGKDHNELINRDMQDQHPISAITDLGNELSGKLDDILPITNEEIYQIVNS